MEYPKNRGKFFAHRLVRVLFKSCAIQDIGHHAATLIVHIAHTEDAARYQGAVRFWNSQLMDVLGFTSPKQLNAARNAAVEAGWLHYERESGRKVGRYWAKVPPEVDQFDDSPIEPIHSESGTNSGMNNGTNSGKLSESGKGIHSELGMNGGTNCGTQSGKPSNPNPNPNPNTPATGVEVVGGEAKAKKPKRPRKPSPDEYTPEFENWWKHFPRKEDKLQAIRPFLKVVDHLTTNRDMAEPEAVEFLCKTADRYARATEDKDRSKIKMASGWLNDHRFDDEYESSPSRPPANQPKVVRMPTRRSPRNAS